MKKNLQLLLLLVLGISFKSFASHDIGGSLNYQEVAPNVYIFTYSHYNWGGGSAAGPFFNMVISSTGCSTSRIVPLTFQTTRHGGFIPITHGSTSYKIATFTGIVTFTTAEAACSNISALVDIGTGQASANANNTAIYHATVANLKLMPNLSNSSPVFDFRNEPVLVAAKYQPITLSIAATDADGDSLVYSLVAPISSSNQPLTAYGTFNANQVNPTPQAPFSATNPQYANLPAPNTFSPTYPLLSYDANWASGQMVNAATKNFHLDATTGALSFTPMSYTAGGNNTYLVSFKVDEYRKINGTQTKIGSIRRESIIIVGDAGANIIPRLANLQSNVIPNSATNVYTITPGQQFTIQADGFDSNAADSVYLVSDAATRLAGATFTTTSAKKQTATLTWTPTATQVSNSPYHFRIWVRDNSQPLAAQRVETFTILVRNSGVMGTKPAFTQGNFIAYPNPFHQEVTFTLPESSKADEVIIYNILGRQIDRLSLTSTNGKTADLRWIKAGNYPAGTYVAKLVTADKTLQTVKFIKVQ